MTSLHIARHLPVDFLYEALARDARAGLTATPKTLPPKWLYDETGSELFQQITRLCEYYPTRAEREILSSRAPEIVAMTDADSLVELGSGSSSEKTRLLLDAMRAVDRLDSYVAVDVSESAVIPAADALCADYPDLAVHAVVADFEHQLELLPKTGRRVVALLGDTIGNFEPEPRVEFLRSLRAVMGDGDSLLIGTDLVKSPDLLLPAYDDAKGVTAAFNRNVLAVLNRELKADFDLDAFDHVVVWDPEQEWIEMRLRSTRRQHVHVAALDLTVGFAAGEEMRTELSAKFRRETLAHDLAAAEFLLQHWWTDADRRFALSLAQPA